MEYQAEGGLVSLQPGYFLQALDLYRQWVGRAGKIPVFLFVSDDLGWARQKLLPRIKTKGGGGGWRDDPYISMFRPGVGWLC